MTVTIENVPGLILGSFMTVAILSFGHYALHIYLSRVQSYIYGVTALLVGLAVWSAGADRFEAVVALGLLAAAGGAATKLFYLADAKYGWKKLPNTTPDRERLFQVEALLAEKELELAQVRAENERLSGTPMAVAEWQRQEAVAALSSSMEILAEANEKLGIAFGNISSIKGVFMNKGALNMSVRTQRELANKK